MNIVGEITSFFKEDSKGFNKKFLMLLFLGISLLILARVFSEEKPVINSENGYFEEKDNIKIEDNNLIDDYATNLEKKLENILPMIKGVGDVKVMVTLDDTAERIPAINTTTNQEKTSEKDAQGGIREVTRDDTSKEVVTNSNNSKDGLIVIKEIKPKVKGVVVVAQGAEDMELKEKLYNAVKTVLGISGSRVEVFPSK